MYVVYLLRSGNLSYIGMTNDFLKRWKQHNGILRGGAKYTHQRNDWTPLCIIDGFPTKSEAMQCEWKLKRARGYYQRVLFISYMFSQSKWTSKSPLIKEQPLTIYIVPDYKHLFIHPTKELVWF